MVEQLNDQIANNVRMYLADKKPASLRMGAKYADENVNLRKPM